VLRIALIALFAIVMTSVIIAITSAPRFLFADDVLY